MNALLAPFKELGEYEEMAKALACDGGKVSLSGCVDSQKVHAVFGLDGDRYDVKIIITYSDIKAREIVQDCRLYCKDTYYYPAKDLIFYQADIHSNQLTKDRIEVQRRILEHFYTHEAKSQLTIVTTFSALMAHSVPLSVIENNVLHISGDSVIDEKALAQKLVNMGYEKNYQVEAPGQFSIRGGIVDIYDLTLDNPVRIELWGDEIESIRSFDVLSQRSIEENMTQVSIYPATEILVTRDELEDGLRKIDKD